MIIAGHAFVLLEKFLCVLFPPVEHFIQLRKYLTLVLDGGGSRREFLTDLPYFPKHGLGSSIVVLYLFYFYSPSGRILLVEHRFQACAGVGDLDVGLIRTLRLEGCNVG